MKLTIKDLHRELDDLAERHGRLDKDELFVLWFLRAYATEDEEHAAKALTGGAGDKDADAILIDDDRKAVTIVQGKLRKDIGGKAEDRNSVMGFARLAEVVCGDLEVFHDHCIGLDPQVRDRLQAARERVQKRKYRFCLYYVTTGRITPAVEKAALKEVRRLAGDVVIDLFSGKRILHVLTDYLDGVAPPIPSLDLEVESGARIRSGGPLTRYDSQTDIESWVFSMAGDAVARLYDQAGIRLFARNIRGFLGSTTINEGMRDTIHTEPEYFWYYNNGITIVCDGAEETKSRGRTVVRVNNPQVINGQQTTRTLHEVTTGSSKASVLVRVIRVSRDGKRPGQEFEQLVSSIVAATNWQNAIRPSDLMANDRQQVEIERQLRKYGYAYLRKRQTKREARRFIKSRKMRVVKKEEFAQAVAACELDPVVVRLGKERLFEEERYGDVFPTGDPMFYLPRYWVYRLVGYTSKGHPERAYAKWVTLHFVWAELTQLFRKRAVREAFVRNAQRRGNAVAAELTWVIDVVFKEVLKFFRKERGRGDQAIDVSSFFKRRGLHHQFEKHWASRANKSKTRFKKYLKRFEVGLQEDMER